MISDLEIKNYRLFNQFEAHSLARVNLIVGNNNSGKSSFLEAIHLLTSDEIRSSLIHILNDRGEIAPGFIDPSFGRNRTGGYQISQVFHDRQIKPGQTASINASGDKKLHLNIVLRSSDITSIKESDQLPMFDLDVDEKIGFEAYADTIVFERNGNELDRSIEKIRITEDGVLDPRYSVRRVPNPKGSSRLLTTNYISYDELSILWDKITLTPKEEKVVEALKILDPNVERLSFTSSQTSNSGILIRLKNEENPIPLGSMGDGMRRILAITASLVSVKNGTLLIDEIDTGLYHRVLTDMWRLIIETSAKQDAQVFATTHSWDCVKAFQQALINYNDPDMGRLLRLEKIDKNVNLVSYSTTELDIAIEQGIEVR